MSNFGRMTMWILTYSLMSKMLLAGSTTVTVEL